MPALQLSFNGTFALKKEDLLKILQVAQDDIGLNDNRQGLMNRTGLGNEKVLRIKSWAKRSGLVNDQTLTPEGQIVVAQDPYLNSPVTDWLMHFYLSFGDQGLRQPPNSPADWGGWTWFVYEFLSQHPTFTKNELVGQASTVFEDTRQKLDKNLKYVLRAYTEDEALSGIQYLQLVDKDKYSAETPELPSPYLMGYCLALLWQRDFTESTSILTQNLWEQYLGFATVFNLSESQFQKALNDLEYANILEQRREVPPFQLIRRWQNPLDLLEKAYMV